MSPSSGEEYSSVSFDKVLLTDNDGQVKVGAPVVKGAAVKCKILKHLKDDKVLVFKRNASHGLPEVQRTPPVPDADSRQGPLHNL